MLPNPSLIARSARWTRWGVTLVLAATILFQAAALLPGQSHVRLHSLGSGPLGTMLGVAHALFMVLALVQLILLLRAFERGELFSAAVTKRIRAFALFSLLAVTVGALLSPLLAWASQACPPGGPCLRRLPIDMRGLWTVITSVVFFLVARLLDEARRIDEDNRQII